MKHLLDVVQELRAQSKIDSPKGQPAAPQPPGHFSLNFEWEVFQGGLRLLRFVGKFGNRLFQFDTNLRSHFLQQKSLFLSKTFSERCALFLQSTHQQNRRMTFFFFSFFLFSL
jgi:hypothetical protein